MINFLSIVIDSYRLLSILLIENNRFIIFPVTSISIDFRYKSILIGGLIMVIGPSGAQFGLKSYA